MPFTLLPAVDVANGQAVRLVQGDAGSATSNGPAVDAALAWQLDGAEWIRLVDLDAAFGRGSNAELLASVVRQLDVKVELAGGIHDDESLNRALATGCERVILASTALANPTWCGQVIEEHGDRIAVSVDVRTIEQSGISWYRLAPRGATRDGIDRVRVVEGTDLWETIRWLDLAGCTRYIVTDVNRDGMLLGPNVDLYRELSQRTSAAVLASGGIATVADLVELAGVTATTDDGCVRRLEGSIVGKALYQGCFTLRQAREALSGPSGRD